MRHLSSMPHRTFNKVMSSNRGEIAIRVFRAATEMQSQTVAVYSKEDVHSLHRYKADQAFLVGEGLSPVQAYLDIDSMVRVAVEHGVDAVHPGYGFLSENAEFAKRLEENGVVFVGPRPETLELFGDKTSARALAIDNGIPVIPGSDGAVATVAEARALIEAPGGIGYPVMIKATHGGGGRGMRVVRSSEALDKEFPSASREALAAFGDGTMFVERLVERPMHVEVQVLGDGSGNAVHLFERYCSVQRRHQKIVEVAPSSLPQPLKDKLYDDALRLAGATKYRAAGTVEFLIDSEKGEYYFIEVNPRIQVEHTVTEEITGVDLVQSQLRLAGGATLGELGLTQPSIQYRGFAIQARVTTENAQNGFAPDYGRIDVYRAAEGMGIRLDAASGFTGGVITPHYDSLLSKVTVHALTFEGAATKLHRALQEFRVRGVSTNIPFISNVLRHPVFIAREAKLLKTDFIESHPELFKFPPQRDRANKLLKYLGHVVVNGHPMPGADASRPSKWTKPEVPPATKEAPPYGWKQVLDQEGPTGFAAAVRQHPRTLLADTTWRDAHQSLFATRMRTHDMLKIAPATSHALAGAFALEMWGGATFDVALRFLKECPWKRLELLRELVPNIPFQMLIRGASAVGYTSYPDNVVYEFAKQAKASGMDVFRVFDSLNYADNLLVGMDAVHAAGGVVQGEMCYTGDLSSPSETKYTLDYYLKLADTIVNKGNTHVLGIKDMAGLLKPRAATELVSALRREFPQVPLHVHTHDTAGVGVASMLAACSAGADVVHGAIDSLSGTTSQPSLGALAASLNQLEQEVAPADRQYPVRDIQVDQLLPIHDYWGVVRSHYAPFDQAVSSGSTDVFTHQMPGGQYSNLLFQSQSVGLASEWPSVKKAYTEANKALGNIVKVTPSSKVVGDLALFMTTNGITSAEQLVERAAELNFPTSVVEFLQGQLGQPTGGFPPDLRSPVLKRAGLAPIDERPGSDLAALDFAKLEAELKEKYGHMEKDGVTIRYQDVISAALFPQVFEEYMEFKEQFGGVSFLPTPPFLTPLKAGYKIEVDIEEGKRLHVSLIQSAAEVDPLTRLKSVYFELNGVPREAHVADLHSDDTGARKILKANKSNPLHVGAPMPGTVVTLRCKEGDSVEAGQPIAVLSAMKMETVVSASRAGVVAKVGVVEGDLVSAGDLIIEMK